MWRMMEKLKMIKQLLKTMMGAWRRFFTSLRRHHAELSEVNLLRGKMVFDIELLVHCTEVLGTPIVGDYRYGWFVHSRWKQLPRVDYEATTGKPYKMPRPEDLDIQKGSVLSKVPLLHLHCREMVLPNIAKFIRVHSRKSGNGGADPECDSE